MGETPWYKKEKQPLRPPEQERDIPSGLVETCKGCKERLYKKQMTENFWVCPKCDHHHRVPSNEWVQILYDEDSWEEFDSGLYSTNPLRFVDSKDYADRLKASQKKTGLDDACLNVRGTIGGSPAVMAILDFFFMGGSMGSVVGEKVTRAAEVALEERIPFITLSCSGGARMQEGMFSLMQLAKTSQACGLLKNAGVPFISILADPSTAGVMATFASLGDLILAEQNALIGFAGPRVIAQTIGGELPSGFQRADFCCDHGMIDIVFHRQELQPLLKRILGMFMDSPALQKSE